MEYGVQIFGCMREFRKDPLTFFQKMKNAGISQIEPCIMFDDPIEFRLEVQKNGNSSVLELPDLLWLPVEVPAFARQLRAMGLKLSSAHAFVSSVEKSGELMLQTAQKCAISSYVLNTPGYAYKEPHKFLDSLLILSEALEEIDVQLWLHNGSGDISTKIEGMPLYRWILENSPGLFAQPDTGWILHGGEDPYSLIKSLGKKLKSLHFKDLVPDYKNKSGNDIFAVLGKGCVDYKKVLELNPENSSLVIDQDISFGNFFEDIEYSVNALKSALE